MSRPAGRSGDFFQSGHQQASRAPTTRRLVNKDSFDFPLARQSTQGAVFEGIARRRANQNTNGEGRPSKRT
ncbi:hypothetical protein AB6813_09200 [bacterium RCC_150]